MSRLYRCRSGGHWPTSGAAPFIAMSLVGRARANFFRCTNSSTVHMSTSPAVMPAEPTSAGLRSDIVSVKVVVSARGPDDGVTAGSSIRLNTQWPQFPCRFQALKLFFHVESFPPGLSFFTSWYANLDLTSGIEACRVRQTLVFINAPTNSLVTPTALQFPFRSLARI